MNRTMSGLNLALSLLLAVLIFQQVSHQLGPLLAALISVGWLALTSILILTVHPLFGRKKAPAPKLPIDVRTSDGVISLQHQLKLCLEYGDVETAEKIASKLQKATQLAQDAGQNKLNKPSVEAYKLKAEELNKLFYSSK